MSKEKLKKLKEDYPDYKKYKYPTLDMRWRIEGYSGYVAESNINEEKEGIGGNNDLRLKRKSVDDIIADIIKRTTNPKNKKRLIKDFPDIYEKVEKENK